VIPLKRINGNIHLNFRKTAPIRVRLAGNTATFPIVLCAAILIGMMFLPSPLDAGASRPLPKFKLKLLDGSVLETKDLLGHITVIDFWATWCKPCLAEIPDYNRFYRDYKGKGVRFIAVASDSGTEEEVQEAVRLLKMEYPVAAPSPKEFDTFGDVIVFPTTWIVDKRGRIAKEFLGAPPEKHPTLRATVDDLLKQPGKKRPVDTGSPLK
jgi:thiol-disulfide isomerase/thioredoxin